MKADIVVGSSVASTTITLDGADVSQGCNEFSLVQKVGELPVLTLRLPLWEAGWARGDDIRLEMHPETREALIRWGWTPPEVESVMPLGLRPGDTLVVRVRGLISPDTAQRISNMMRETFPEQPVLIVDDSISDVEAVDHA